VRVEKVAGRRALSIIHIYGMTSHNEFSAGFKRICGEFDFKDEVAGFDGA
jgi:hypothetical protein